MIIIHILAFLPVLLLMHMSSEPPEIPDWIKDNAEKLTLQNNFNNDNLMSVLENLSNTGIIKNTAEYSRYVVPNKGKTVFVNISGNVHEYGKTGFATLVISKPDGSKEILHTPILETGSFSTVFPITELSQKGMYSAYAEFAGNKTSVTYFYLVDNDDIREKIPYWFVTVFHWWMENKISDKEFIHNVQHLIDNHILIVFTNDPSPLELHVSVEGHHQVRRGTTHTIVSHVTYGGHYVEGAKVSLSIEDYGENVIREFDGFTNDHGDFIFSWEVPKKFNDVETLIAYIDVTYNDSSITKLFKFQVYCLPGEPNCEIDGN